MVLVFKLLFLTLKTIILTGLSAVGRAAAAAACLYLDDESRGHGRQVLLQRQLQVLVDLVWENKQEDRREKFTRTDAVLLPVGAVTSLPAPSAVLLCFA